MPTSPLTEPVWYDPLSPLGSAVKYVAALSPKFNWVGIYVFKGHVLELGPYMGAPRESLTSSQEPHSKLVVLIQDSSGRILGQLEIDSHTANAFGAAEEQAVRQIAKELGERWPEARS